MTLGITVLLEKQLAETFRYLPKFYKLDIFKGKTERKKCNMELNKSKLVCRSSTLYNVLIANLKNKQRAKKFSTSWIQTETREG